MDKAIQQHLDNLQIKDAVKRADAFLQLLKITDHQVDWTYEAWDTLLDLVKNGDNHQRAIGAQLLANLAKSDPEQRISQEMSKLFKVTRDERFVTARHSLQCLWKIGIVNPALREQVMAGLAKRFRECDHEKNCTLIRYDIAEVLRKMYDHTPDAKLKQLAKALVESETDEKYRKKYTGVWKDVWSKDTK